MKDNNYLENTNFKSLIEVDDKNHVEETLNIIDVFLGTEEHITVEQLCCLLREKGYDYEPVFVRHCINRMVDLGFAQKNDLKASPFAISIGI